MRKIAIAFVAFELLALTACGYTLADDTELMAALSWVREFKSEHPQQARAYGHECKKVLTESGYSRDGALKLFTCIRKEAEAQGYA
jgi:outer membrane lipopolysaccharide assembly protein LptE/RlpB